MSSSATIPAHAEPLAPAIEADAILSCPVCGQAHRSTALPDRGTAYCVRCGARIGRHVSNSLQKTIALALAALILYLPANVFPILHMQRNGLRSHATVLGSTRLLYEDGDYFIALIVFLASIVIPLVKLAGLLYLAGSTWLGASHGMRLRTRLFRWIEAIGKWAMLDVFVLAVLVSVVKLRGLATVTAGAGVFPFLIVVLLTLFATASFDPQLIWKNGKRNP